ncbi:hypothetical protein [Turneriella parva]|uniref:Zinc-finger domain-containing protein n=1 Tax=Turneriella parva (strain ATCC BAA-1111 / DSM 21527 / NCTC 11395 / H) TaxID=869212 RepID=I4B148_TURPD|nr:hypothetical protein [Turneriella parva]AFM11005.1 hypothetical protein Turpa_0345 [Turneriella parva DSM 21527]
MNCSEYTRHASTARDEKPSFKARVGMAIHWVLCIYCRRFTRQLGAISRQLRRQEADAKMPAGLRQEIASRFEKPVQ